MDILKSVGIGFGPSNIALAIALEELRSSGLASSHVFFDNRVEPDWHPGLMYPESTMQISFLKDLITMVNPTSRFTFLNFLVAKGRIHEFINLRNFYPRRTEFEDYVKWCAKQLSSFSEFNSSVCDIQLTDPSDAAGSDLTVTIENTKSGKRKSVRTRSITLADGGFPFWPLPQPQGCFQNLFHSSQTLHRLKLLDLNPEGSHVFHIVGSGCNPPIINIS